jgi:catechol 2,3-dioxygenase-like lactoylglutathione lyase family enzyme
MKETTMNAAKTSALLGLRTVIYYVPDLERAKQWYGSLLGIAPYFDTPYYVGYNVGGFELGLHPAEGHPPGPGGAVAYWGVERMAEAWPRALALPARAVSAPNDVGEGILVATVEDPFGNHVGLIENPHFPNTA